MHQCVFPRGPTILVKKNESLDIKLDDDKYSFKLGGITFKGENESKNVKSRVILKHKNTGEMLILNSDTLTFQPEIEKLQPKQSGSNLGATYSELTREYGSAKDQKILREKEKLKINKEAQNTLKLTSRDVLKDEKIDASKGNKLQTSSLDSNLDGNPIVINLSNLTDSNHCIKLSEIIPKMVIDSLQLEAESVINLKMEEIEKLTDDLSFKTSILDLLRKWPVFDLRKIQLAILLEYMIRFLNLPIKTIRQREPLPGCPALTMDFLFLNFTKEVLSDGTKSVLQVPKEEKDKLFLVIIALYGYLSNYQFPINHFMVDTKAGRDRIKKLGQLINMRLILIDKEHFMKSTKPYIIEDF